MIKQIPHIVVFQKNMKWHTEADNEKFISSKKSFQKEIRKAKRAKWQEFVNSVTDPKSMALLKHALTKQPTVKIGLLKKPDGSFSKNFHDSIRTLMKEHFPGSPKYEDKISIYIKSILYFN